MVQLLGHKWRIDKSTCLSFEYADGTLQITRVPFSDTIPINCVIDGLLGVYSLSNGNVFCMFSH